MMHSFKTLIFMFLLSSLSLGASEIVWIDFQLNHAYNDLETACTSVRTGSTLYFAAEMEEGKLVRAALHDTPRSGNKTLELTAEDLKQIELFKDTKGLTWIKKFPLSAPLLKWILFNVPRGTFPQFCLLPQPLKTALPTSIVYEFDPQEIEEFRSSTSKKISFSGTRQDERNYQAKIQLIQQEFKYEKL